MGDRCTLMVEVHPDDQERLELLVGDVAGEPDEIDDEREGGAVLLTWFDVNGGAGCELDDAALAGLRFVAWNGEGCEYGCGLSVAFGGESIMLDGEHDGMRPLLPVEEDGTIDPGNMEKARTYARLLASYRASLPKKEAARG